MNERTNAPGKRQTPNAPKKNSAAKKKREAAAPILEALALARELALWLASSRERSARPPLRVGGSSEAVQRFPIFGHPCASGVFGEVIFSVCRGRLVLLACVRAEVWRLNVAPRFSFLGHFRRV